MNPILSSACRPNRLAARAVLTALTAFLGTASLAHASSLLLVDPSVPTAYAEIQPAVDAAAPGDIVIVRPLADISARYLPFALGGKSITVVGQGTLGTILCTTMEITDTASSDIIIVRGLDFAAPAGVTAIALSSGAGALRIEDCNAVGGVGDTVSPAPAMYAGGCTNVIINNCHFTGGAALTGAPDTTGAAGIQTLESTLNIRGGSYVGGAGANGVKDEASDGGLGGPGLSLGGGWQYLGDGLSIGGAGGNPGCGTGPGCLCGVPGNGGDAVTENGTILILQAQDLQPGSPAESLCASGVAGLPLSQNGGVLQDLGGPVYEYTMSYPAMTGVLEQFHFKGVVGEYIFISASTIPVNKYLPKYDGALQLLDSNILDFYFLRIIDSPDGVHNTTHPVTAPPPGIDGAMIYTQAFFVTFAPPAPPKIQMGPSSTFIYIGYGP
jgi:hypothetical protein